MNADDVVAVLRSKYSGREWAFMVQVPNGTGLAKDRTCDCLAMSLWPSKGLHLHGFEIKVSRSDWLKEIQDPTKANAFAVYCHYWWIVAPKGVVKPEEAAGDWGIQEVTDSGNLRTKKAPTLREPIPVDHAFLAGLLRSAFRQGTEAEIELSYQKGYDAGRIDGRKSAEHDATLDHGNDNRDLELLREAVANFQKASGIEIHAYGGRRLGELVAAARKIENGTQSIEVIRRRLQQALESLSGE